MLLQPLQPSDVARTGAIQSSPLPAPLDNRPPRPSVLYHEPKPSVGVSVAVDCLVVVSSVVLSARWHKPGVRRRHKATSVRDCAPGACIGLCAVVGARRRRKTQRLVTGGPLAGPSTAVPSGGRVPFAETSGDVGGSRREGNAESAIQSAISCLPRLRGGWRAVSPWRGTRADLRGPPPPRPGGGLLSRQFQLRRKLGWQAVW